LNSPQKVGWASRIAAYIPIQTQAGKAGAAETASVAGPCDVIARAQARDTGELAKLEAARAQALGGVMRTMSCPVIHL
jgi:hypothetical protein